MAKYAVNEEGVQALHLSSKQIVESVQSLIQLATQLKDQSEEGSEVLGPHKSSLNAVLLELYSGLKESVEPAERISDALSEVAEAYQEIIENNKIQNDAQEGSGLSSTFGAKMDSPIQTQHKTYITQYQDQVKAVQSDVKNGSGVNISPERASQLLHSVHEFSGTASTRIRKAYHNPNAPDRDKELMRAVDDYIRAAPKWKGRVYRGINVTKDQASAILSGAPIDMLGPSSWSTDKGVAERFSNGYKEQRIVFVLDDNKSGTSITHIGSWNGTESEVTAPSGVLYDPSGTWIEKNGADDIIYISVHERSV